MSVSPVLQVISNPSRSRRKPMADRRLWALAFAAVLCGCGGGPSMEAPGGSGSDLAQRRSAATATASGNAQCLSIRPFYWEIGDGSSALASGSESRPGGAAVSAGEVMSIASASKWLYSTYYVERTRGVLSPTDIKFLNFHSGYTNLSSCSGAATVADCLSLDNGKGGTNGDFDPATQDKFFYNGGHMQRHAATNGLGDLDNVGLASALRSQLGTDIQFTFGQPQPAGGVFMSATEYAKVLRKILSGKLVMQSVLGTHAVCTDPSSCADALASPAPKGERWHYSIGHWVEDDPSVGDGAFSSPGAFGFYPWIDRSKTYYGIVARLDPIGAIDSVDCGRLIRKAWVTARPQ